MTKVIFFEKKFRKNLHGSQKLRNFASQIRNKDVSRLLGYGVMVTLQILVLPFLVRVRVSQLKAFIFQRWMLFLYTINTLYYFFYVTLHGIGGLLPSIVKKILKISKRHQYISTIYEHRQLGIIRQDTVSRRPPQVAY